MSWLLSVSLLGMSTPYIGNSIILSTKICDHAVCAMTPVIVFLGYSAVYEILLQSGKVAQWVKVLLLSTNW